MAETRPKLLTFASYLPFAIAAIVVLGVIPQARVNPTARKAFLVNAVLNILVGVAYRRKSDGKALVVVAALGAVLLGLALLDAASAYNGDPGMAFVAAALFVCVAADLGAATLGFIAVWRSRYRGVVSIVGK